MKSSVRDEKLKCRSFRFLKCGKCESFYLILALRAGKLLPESK